MKKESLLAHKGAQTTSLPSLGGTWGLKYTWFLLVVDTRISMCVIAYKEGNQVMPQTKLFNSTNPYLSYFYEISGLVKIRRKRLKMEQIRVFGKKTKSQWSFATPPSIRIFHERLFHLDSQSLYLSFQPGSTLLGIFTYPLSHLLNSTLNDEMSQLNLLI